MTDQLVDEEPALEETQGGDLAIPSRPGELEPDVVDAEIVDEPGQPAVRQPRLVGKRRLNYRYTARLEHELGYAEHSSIEVQRACPDCPNPASSFGQVYGLLARAAYATREHGAPTAKTLGWHTWYGMAGLGRGVARWWAWVTAADYAARENLPVDKVEATQRRRWIITGVFAVLVAASWEWWRPAPFGALLLALVIASIVERKRRGIAAPDKPLAAAGRMPGSRVVREAFGAAKLGEVRVVGPVTRDGPAWTAVVELPPGRTASEALARRENLAGAFGVDLAQVYLDRIGGHAGRIRVTVFDTDPWQARPVKSPLLTAAQWNVWEQGVPIGVDARGRIITVRVFERSVLIGGEPGGGKSVAAMAFLAAVALDPHVQLWLGDGKGVDSKVWEPLAHRVAASADPMALVVLLEELVAEVDRRYLLLRKADKKKIDRSMRLPLIVLWIDELMRYTTATEKIGDGKTKVGDRIVELLRHIVSLGRAAGIITICATQKPSADVVPTILRDLLSIRLALRCTTPQASDTILGQGWARQGFNAAQIDSAQRGAGHLFSEGSEPQMLRTFYFEDADERAIATRAIALREAEGTLQLPADHPRRRLMVAILDAFGDDDRLPTEELLERLAEAGLHFTPTSLADELRPAKVAPKQLRVPDPASPGGTRNRNGYAKEVVEKAYAAL
ncbi:FtsK/SpoIIIE domain-containing protein [Sphaerimonospora thailandensis]|uniref:FtsK domain-containing protein n=1 Tax=Sphaerimonospora thailandensis TaxID=795644 RepID=A0A8J3VZR2_9ACTN|nr:FtsK/SpoIIIE domain-containing protein [Sphaerimonospora thailandensis]GIH70370.1 hypothetical protein Mth01_26230 [Sphaerimonospora thailandensis]